MMSVENPSELSFDEIYVMYHDRIFRHVYRIISQTEEAEDITQNTFLRVYQRLNTLQNPQALSAWLYRIATNICCDEWRKRVANGIEPVDLDQISESMDESKLPKLDSVIDQDEMSNCIHRYITRLSDEYRHVILLHDLNNMTCREIAQILGCSLEAVKIRLSRARQKLQTSLTEACHFSNNAQGVFICDPKSKLC